MCCVHHQWIWILTRARITKKEASTFIDTPTRYLDQNTKEKKLLRQGYDLFLYVQLDKEIYQDKYIFVCNGVIYGQLDNYEYSEMQIPMVNSGMKHLRDPM